MTAFPEKATRKRTAVLRLLAFAIDWLILALWGGVLFGFVMFATGGDPPRPGGPWTAQMLGFLTMTLPFTLYFAFCESSGWHASIGKRVLRIGVTGRSGQQLSLGRALLRNAIKFVPWEFGHTLAHRAALEGDGDLPVWLWVPAAIAAAGSIWWLAALFLTGETPYDRWTGVRVARLSEERRTPETTS